MDLSEYLRTRFATQAEAAAKYNVTQGAISHWVSGRRRPRPEVAAQIVKDSRGKCSYADIFGIRRQPSQ